MAVLWLSRPTLATFSLLLSTTNAEESRILRLLAHRSSKLKGRWHDGSREADNAPTTSLLDLSSSSILLEEEMLSAERLFQDSGSFRCIISVDAEQLCR